MSSAREPRAWSQFEWGPSREAACTVKPLMIGMLTPVSQTVRDYPLTCLGRCCVSSDMYWVVAVFPIITVPPFFLLLPPGVRGFPPVVWQLTGFEHSVYGLSQSPFAISQLWLVLIGLH